IIEFFHQREFHTMVSVATLSSPASRTALNSPSGWATVHSDLLLLVFSRLKPYECAPAGLACRRWHAIHIRYVKLSLIAPLEETSLQLACTLPNFDELKASTTLSKVRTSFVGAFKPLFGISSHDFLGGPREQRELLFTLVERLIKAGQDYVLWDLSPLPQIPF